MTLERTYIIPLRREWLKAQRYKRAKKAVTGIRTFLKRHMKSEDIKIGKYLNLELWKHGIRNPPSKIKITATKDDKGTVRAELFGAPVEKEAELKKTKKQAEKQEQTAETKGQAAEEKPAEAKAPKKAETKPAEKQPEKKTPIEKKAEAKEKPSQKKQGTEKKTEAKLSEKKQKAEGAAAN